MSTTNKTRSCPRCYHGGVGVMTVEEKRLAGLDTNKQYVGCDECSYYEEIES